MHATRCAFLTGVVTIFLSFFHLINFIDVGEEHSNIQEADDLLKLANKLDPNSTLELEIEWYMKIKQNGGVQKL